MKRPTGKDLGGYRKRGWWTLAPRLWHSLSLHSAVCKKSPNLLAALLPLLNLGLKQCKRWVGPCAGKGRFPGEIRPKKEWIKSCETYFANTLNLNDKGPSLKWICFPKSYSPLANWPWLRISPQSSLFVIYCLILSMIDELYLYSVQTEPNKSPLRKMLLALLLWEIGHLSSPSRSCLGRLILICGGWGGALWAEPPHISPVVLFLFLPYSLFSMNLFPQLFSNKNGFLKQGQITSEIIDQMVSQTCFPPIL